MSEDCTCGCRENVIERCPDCGFQVYAESAPAQKGPSKGRGYGHNVYVCQDLVCGWWG